MRSTPLCTFLVLLIFFVLQTSLGTAQKKSEGIAPKKTEGMAVRKSEKKYPALLWEISGRGMKKPSWLFGTMHVSSKLVFHLSDSFYMGIRNSDVVALELDPQLWQDQMYRFQNMQTNLRFYTQGSPGDYINEKSFQLEKYEDRLRAALSDEPTVINGLLYRTYQTRADFEEDTYLDLYIYQTGKKLGKLATGVENYFQTEQLVMEAAQDMMKDKKKRSSIDSDGPSPYELEKKTQEAYRKGDLDLLDSLERLMQPSDSYMEKFLYRRNEIQAASIDSILQHHSLFVGVGAAHLPGKRGVIELLRKMGYTLRPVGMADRDALQKDDIDKIRVPVHFAPFAAEDGDFSVQLPGKLYRRSESRIADSWQYADMSNGAYYMIGRVKTHSYFVGQKEDLVLRKVDSLLYENIPGKIIRKTPITRSGYNGYDLTSRTRRGDIQRYNILVTPNEVLVFKMSGNNSYVEGKEADQFFGSIAIRPVTPAAWAEFSPPQGGFGIRMPRQPVWHENKSNMDGITRWEYEAIDSVTGDAFLVWKKSVQNFRFLEEDTVNLALMEESFRLSDYIDRTLSRKTGLYRGSPCLDAVYQQKDGSYLRARFLLRGPHYYLLAAHSRGKEKNFSAWFDSFRFQPFQYASFRNYVDTFINIRVTTPVVPDIDPGLRSIFERSTSEEFLNSLPDYNSYWPRPRTALFQYDSTGESIYVSMETFPKYYYPKDSAQFWVEEANEKKIKEDLVILEKKPLRFAEGDSTGGIGGGAGAGRISGYRYVLSDTNTSGRINTWVFMKGNRFYRIACLDDSTGKASAFIERFFSSLRPLDGKPGPSVFSNKLDSFFADFYSRDSLVSKRAKEAIPNVYFGARGVPALLKAIRTLPYNDKDYFTVKTKLINELGYINDSVAVNGVVAGLKTIYEEARDTSTLQNAVLKALAHHKTRPAYELLRSLVEQDPPVFDNNSDYSYLFSDLGDSLALARILFPGLLKLAAVDDYKDNVQSLLCNLVDSGYMKAKDYESWFSQLYFDAKIQWKKQEGRDEKKMQKHGEDGGDDSGSSDSGGSEDGDNPLENFSILLMPFYEQNATVPHFFEKMLHSRDAAVRLSTVIQLIRYGHPVPDSIILALAASDQYRSRLWKRLESLHRTDRFPRKYLNQPDMARSVLASSRADNDLFAIEPQGRQFVQIRDKKGYVYFFRYKPGKDDEWQMGFSGIQPLNAKEVSTDNSLTRLSNKRIQPDTPAQEQFARLLKRMMISQRKSGASFYLDNEFYIPRGGDDD